MPILFSDISPATKCHNAEQRATNEKVNELNEWALNKFSWVHKDSLSDE